LDKLAEGTAKQGTIKLHKKRKRWFVSISLKVEKETKQPTPKVMGIDLGLKNLATASVGTTSLFFNGKHVAFKRRFYSARRKKLGKAKKLTAIKKSKDKESQWMRDKNHKISRQIVDFSLRHGVSKIRMEDLTGIRMRRSKKEAGRNLNSWSFHQLQTLISYKAEMAGIIVEFVNPKYTSQTCKCGYRDKRNRCSSRFQCQTCGYKQNADLNAGINIAKAISGLSKKKKAA